LGRFLLDGRFSGGLLQSLNRHRMFLLWN
jgi:hypothetical protein